MFKTVEEIEAKIRAYFNEDLPKKTKYTAKGEPYEVEVPTVSGLALYLGFVDRRSFYDYEDKPEFTHAIKKARFLIEKHYEELAQDGVTTAIFALKNFGWSDASQLDVTSDGKSIAPPVAWAEPEKKKKPKK